MTDTKGGTKSKGSSRATSSNKNRGGAESKQSNHSNSQNKRSDYFQGELQRLKESLQKEKSQIIKPKRQKHTPYTFVSLGAYCSTNIVSQVVLKDPTQPNGYINRNTAIGLTDPWVDHTMDNDFKPDPANSKPTSPTPGDDGAGKKKGDKKKKGGKKVTEGSTRLPKFPAVSVPAGELTTKKLSYSDVPMLRQQIRDKYSQNAGQKVDEEYTRTKQDYYRMDLDKLEEYHPINRDHMRKTYFAYLQNNPGSKKAIYECVRESQKELQESEAGSRPHSARSHHSSRPHSSRSRQSIKD